MIKRHTLSAILMHWFNALCWLLLLCTGFALLMNPLMQPVGQWWVSLWNGLLGAQGVLVLHLTLGLAWVVVYALYIVLYLRQDIMPFLREIFDLSLASDLIWCVRKGAWLLLGAKGMAKMGFNPHLPPQGFYNAGQKLVAVAAVACSLGLALTGLVLTALALHLINPVGFENAAQWILLLHFACAGIMAIALPVHIYMAAFAPGEGPALRSMFTGYVPENFIKHHNPLWYQQLVSKGLLVLRSERK